MDTQTNIVKAVAEILIKNNLTVTVAESCTAGLVLSCLTDISGSSTYLKEGLVTYSNKAKQKYLNVKKITLDEFGAVSEQTVVEMVNGLLTNTDADVALAVSGIAGPNSDESNKPVGMVWLAVANRNKSETKLFQSKEKYERITMKNIFAQEALKLLLNFLRENY